MAAVNTKTCAVEPADLRAFCARNRLCYADIGRALGCSRNYVRQVANADVIGKSVSQQKLRDVQAVALRLLWERDAR